MRYRLFTVVCCVLSSSLMASTKICLTGSTVKIFKNYGRSFIQGAKLAASEHKDVSIVDYFYDRSPLSAREMTKKMIAEKCHVIIGYSNMNDLLQSEGLGRKHGIPIISLYSVPGEKSLRGPVLTMQPSTLFFAEKILKYFELKKQMPKNTLIVTALNIPSFKVFQKELAEKLEKKGGRVYLYETLENKFHDDDFKKFLVEKKKSFDTVILLSRSMVAARSSDILHVMGQKPFIIGTANFGSATLPAFYNKLKHKEVEGLFVRQHSVFDLDEKYLLFKEKYREKFKESPMVISGYAFDAIHYFMKARKKSRNTIDELKRTEHFGITGVKFEKNFKTSIHKCFVVKVDRSGHSLVRNNSLCHL